MSKQEQSITELSPCSDVVDLAAYRAERNEFARRERVLEVLKQLETVSFLKAAPCPDSTVCYLDNYRKQDNAIDDIVA